MDMSVLGVLTELNSKVLLTSRKSSSENIAVFLSFNSTDSVISTIDHGPALFIIAQSIPSFSSFSALTELAFSLLFQNHSGSSHAGLRLPSRFLVLVFCAAFVAVADGFRSTAAMGSYSCFNSDELLFSSFEIEGEVRCSLSHYRLDLENTISYV